MNNQELIKKLKEGAVLIDVRESYEFNEAHIKGAINVALSNFIDNPLIPKDLNKEIILYCRSGARSEDAKNYLNMIGYKNVINLGGIDYFDGEIIK